MIAAILFAIGACACVAGVGVAFAWAAHEIRTAREDARRVEHHHLEVGDEEAP